jgi:hypothetical protein
MLRDTIGAVILQVYTASRTGGVLCGALKVDELSPPELGVVVELERVCTGVINHDPLYDAFHTTIATFSW